MRRKNLITLIIVLGVLVVIYLIQNLSTDRKTMSESLVDLCPDFNSSSVNQIKVYKQAYPDSGLMFSKKDGLWLLESYFGAPARQSEIEKLLGDVKGLQGEIRSTNQELFGDFEITEDVALHMEFVGVDSAPLIHILVGKGVPKACFARNNGSDTVFMANTNFVSRFAAWNAEPSKRMPGKRWAELTMTDFDKEKVNQIELKINKKTYRFEKKEEISGDTLQTISFVWQQVEPSKGKLEEKKITDMLNRISSLRGNEIIGNDTLKEYKLDKPSHVASVTTGDGVTASFNFGAFTDTTETTRYASIEGRPHVYKLAKYNFESIFVNPFKED
ncbi:MAG: DUF4340 domain-containing protein [candidate division Zixibacteria bacterium]|nr:DUF4340 domain-containing protein [candidate division Zixibacteria bacterium]